LGGEGEAVEEESGAARVELVEGDVAEDFSDGELDGGAAVWGWEVDGVGGCIPP